MGNSIGRGRKKVKVMKITGETFKLKTPVHARDAVTGYPDHVLLDSDSVKQLGVRARPLDPEQPLKPNKLYFLVQLPDNVSEISGPAPRRIRSSGVQMNAKERLECLMLSRRSASELPMARSAASYGIPQSMEGSGRQVRMRLSKAQMAELVNESKDEAEVAEKVFRLYMTESKGRNGRDEINGHGTQSQYVNRADQSKAAGLGLQHEKRVRFDPVGRGEIVELAASL